MENQPITQVRTQINVDLTNRDRQTVLLRVFLVFPPLIFLFTFSSNVNVGIFASVGGFLFFPALLALLFRGVYPSYCLAYNKAYLSLSNRVTAYLLLLTDQYPSIEESKVVTLSYPEIEDGKKTKSGNATCEMVFSDSALRSWNNLCNRGICAHLCCVD